MSSLSVPLKVGVGRRLRAVVLGVGLRIPVMFVVGVLKGYFLSV